MKFKFSALPALLALLPLVAGGDTLLDLSMATAYKPPTSGTEFVAGVSSPTIPFGGGSVASFNGGPTVFSGNAVVIAGGTNTNNIALAVVSRSSGEGLTVNGQNVTGLSHGLTVIAGTNASDANTGWNNASGSQLGFIAGDGGLVMGTPTGGDQGLGTINAGAMFVNGVAVSTTAIANGVITSAHCPAAGGATGVLPGGGHGIANCTQSSGIAIFTFSPTLPGIPNCTATSRAAQSSGNIITVSITAEATTSVSVTSYLNGVATSEPVTMFCQIS
jgi:hypothetical protein